MQQEDRTMKFMLFVLPTVPATLEERRQLRPIGRNTERYQRMPDDFRKLAVFADDAGFDVFATAEHHFHSEGYEASVAPLLLYADLAARTKRIKFSPLGLVLPSWDPIRAAEELAVLDQLTKGRIDAGFARGYQDRWINVLGQQYHVTGAPMDGSAIDNHSRRVYEETLKVIRKAWTEETFEYNGEYYKVPYPYEEGIRRWPVAEWTRAYGAPGEVDAEGVVRKISVVPKPYQDPHPPLFQPFSVSENTIRYTAQSGIVPWILVSHPPDFERLCRLYQDVAATAGRDLRLGESVGAFRAVHFGRTQEEAVELFRQSNYAGFANYLASLTRPPAERATQRAPGDSDPKLCEKSGTPFGESALYCGKCHSGGRAMQYRRISADCHLDLPWLPAELFISEAPREFKDRMPY